MTLTYVEYGRGEALLFLHGIGGNASVWQPQLDYFARAYRTIAWDMPGYGASEPLAAMTFPALADALLSLLDNLGLEQAHIIGHSMGGMVAQEFAGSYPERLRSLVLAATSPAFGRPDGAWQQQFLRARLEPLEEGKTMLDLASDLVTSMVGEKPDPLGIENAIGCMERVPTETYRSALKCLITFDRREQLGSIAAPTLLLAGENDRVAPARVMQKMAARMRRATYICIPGAGHLANIEQPQVFNHELERFLRDTIV